MPDFANEQNQAYAANIIKKLQELQKEKRAIENRSHNGFSDVVRSNRLDSEIEYLEELIRDKQQRAVTGQG